MRERQDESEQRVTPLELFFDLGGGWGHGRPVATVVLLALIPVATQVPALAALALVAAVCAALIAYEALRYPYARSWIRSHRGAFTMEEASRIAPTRGRNPEDQPTSTDPNSGRPVGR